MNKVSYFHFLSTQKMSVASLVAVVLPLNLFALCFALLVRRMTLVTILKSSILTNSMVKVNLLPLVQSLITMMKLKKRMTALPKKLALNLPISMISKSNRLRRIIFATIESTPENGVLFLRNSLDIQYHNGYTNDSSFLNEA